MQNHVQNPSIDEPGGQENPDSFQLNSNQRGCMRILGGAVPTGERLFRAGMRKTALCPFCLKGEIETSKHLWWECTATEECRKDVKNEISQEDLEVHCQKSPRVVESFLTIQNSMNGSQHWQGMVKMRKRTWPPQEEDDCSDFSYDSEGFLKVAGDGACPSGQGDYEAERLRSRSVLWQRKQTQLCHTNPRSSTRSATKRSQSSLEMGLVGVEQNRLHHGLSAGQRRHRSDLPRQKEKAKITQRPLEKNCIAALHAKGLESHRVEKVKAHQSKKQKEEETQKEASARKKERGSRQESVGSSCKERSTESVGRE